MITLLDYGAGNVRSVVNALEALGEKVKLVKTPEDILSAEKLIFPGVGNFSSLISTLHEKNFFEPLKRYLLEDRPFLGICLGLQALFEYSEEAPGIKGLGIFKGYIKRFDTTLSIPHIGWNGIKPQKSSRLFDGLTGEEKFYFVHSYHVETEEADIILCTTDYGYEFVSAIEKGNIIATQFHPEKSGQVGLKILKNFLEANKSAVKPKFIPSKTKLAKRIVACLDVRTNDDGDLVVTKGDQYDVREKGQVRNLGKPVELARRYYTEGADEITFLNITGFRDFPLKDLPMLEVLRLTSKNVFVPLTIGGGIRDFTDRDGNFYSALEVASEYFRSGADKISIGSDAVLIVEEYLHTGKATGKSSIETISKVYGTQAVVISIDPRRVYVDSPEKTKHPVIETSIPGPNGERYCWFQCTIKGGREGRDIDAVTLAKVCEKLGAGEILLNSIDRDGTNLGFDLELIQAVKEAVSIPVIASSGAGSPEHFYEVFTKTEVEAALAAGIFHRQEVSIEEVKRYLKERGIEIRPIFKEELL
ncbi:imidazoleglycerol phosphate synthase, cyclase subunit [Thermodesulfatator indicus DSM 15286]|uniref:Imidazole glycerol phosphate synthase subunit HisH n=1 Tax=Thermodesulfatator indicus (strain DSM 15286 / JCM 11887 / CIR29812) TaxID=667014 RepID=F8ADA3_THEID|nr:imidazole glycerol phosphate synthase HisHF [Thermodesulfatator indicus]AEH44842.1 imidazoleglycerol phosphate synthase, cyclase subunit [Thermodesulfatator indicus DSM 15286]